MSQHKIEGFPIADANAKLTFETHFHIKYSSRTRRRRLVFLFPALHVNIFHVDKIGSVVVVVVKKHDMSI